MPTLVLEALQAISSDDRARLERSTALYPNTAIEDVIVVVRRKQQYCLSSRYHLTRSNGEVVSLPDIFYKVVLWLQKFREVGDVVAQYDPSHAALPWAAMRFLLQTLVNDAESLAAVAEGLEIITKNYSRCRLLEAALLSTSNLRSGLAIELRAAVVSFYCATLTYLARAGKFYSTKPSMRFIRNTFRTKPALSTELTTVREKADEVRICSAGVTAEATQHNTEILRMLADQLSSIETPILRLQPMIEAVQKQISKDKLQDIVQWICPIAHWSTHIQHVKDLVPGTGIWLHKHAVFLQWQTSSVSSIFWLKGNPGWGKTKAAAAFTRFMSCNTSSSSTSSPVSYVYCSSATSSSPMYRAEIILQSLVRQLSVSSTDGTICSETQDLYNQRLAAAHTETSSILPLDVDESVEIILRIAMKTPITIVIDGLDEVDSTLHVLTHALCRIVAEATLLVKIFVTSRPMDIKRFENSQTISYTIQPSDTETEVKTFVEYQVDKAVKEKRLLQGKISAQAKTRIVQTLSGRADGLFLWSSLQLNRICDNTKFLLEEDVLTSLERLSDGLEQVFDRIWDRVLQYESNARKVVSHAISWLLVAQRPLSKSELLTACALDVNGSIRLQSFEEADLSNLCGSLIVLDETQTHYKFLHRSVQEYFSSHAEFSFAAAHTIVLNRCLACYTMEAQEASDQGNETSSMAVERLQAYACLYWMDHFHATRGSSNRQEAEKRVSHFAFDAEGLYFGMWLEDIANFFAKETVWTVGMQKLHAVLSADDGVIHVAAAYDICFLIEQSMSHRPSYEVNESINALNLEGAHPVYCSARFGNAGALRVLLTHGALPDVTGGHMGNPLQAAAYWGHDQCVRLLLDQGADCHADGRFSSALDAALAGANEAVIMTFITKQLYEAADTDRILETACQKGLNLVVKTIAQSFVASDSQLLHSYLQKALVYGNYRATQIWIDKIDDVNAVAGHYRNALQAAAFGGHERCIALIVDRGASLTSTGLYGSALRAAALVGNDKAVKFFLDRGARDGDAVIAAAQNGHASTLHLLLDAIEPESDFSDQYPLALNAASLAGQDMIVSSLLLRFGPDQYSRTEQQALKIALFHGNATIITAFTNHYKQMREISGVTLVPCSAGKGPSLLEGVFSRDVFKDVSQYIDEKFSALFGCSMPNHNRIADGGHTLRLAARLGNKAVIEQLLQSGHATHGGDRDWSRPKCLPVEISAAYGHIAAFDTLIENGSNIGRSLVFATRFGQVQMVQHILKSLSNVEVDLEWSDFQRHIVEPDRGQSNFQEHVVERNTSASFEFLNDSALGLAIELANVEIFELLWNHKLKSAEPLPNVSLIRASANDDGFYLTKMLEKHHVWRDSSNMTNNISTTNWTRNGEVEINLAIHNHLLRSIVSKSFDIVPSSGSRSSMVLQHCIAEAAGSSSYNLLKQLLLVPSEPLILYNSIINAATVACKSERFNPLKFLNACSVDGKAGAILLEIGLTSSLKSSRTQRLEHSLTISEIEMAGRVHIVLDAMRDLYTGDLNGLDAAIARLCRHTIVGQWMLVLRDILAFSAQDRKPLKHVPDIVHDLLDVTKCNTDVNAPYFGTTLRLLMQYGANVESTRQSTVLIRICTKGLATGFFHLISSGFSLPTQEQIFDVEWALRQTCHWSSWSHCDLLVATTRAFVYSVDGSLEQQKKSLFAGFAEIILSLLDSGYSCDIENEENVTFCRFLSYISNEVLLSRLIFTSRSFKQGNHTLQLNKLGVLHAATLGGNSELVRRLVDFGADPTYVVEWSFPESIETPNRGSPVLIAVRTKPKKDVEDRDLVLYALRALVDVGISETDQQLAFSYAMVGGKDIPKAEHESGAGIAANDLIERLFQKGVDITAANQILPFIESVIIRGDMYWLRKLFREGLDLERAESKPLDLVRIAAHYNRSVVIDFLFETFPDLPKSDELDNMADEAIRKGRIEGSLAVKRDCYDIDRLHEIPDRPIRHSLLGKLCADFLVDAAEVENLLQSGANANLLVDGWTPLTLLLDASRIELGICLGSLEVLLDHGADPNKPRETVFNGRTVFDYPIHLAIAITMPRQVIKMLLDAGADVSVDGGFGTPLFQLRLLDEQLIPFFLSVRPEAEEREGNFSYEGTPDGIYVRFGPNRRSLLTTHRGFDSNSDSGDQDLRNCLEEC